MNQVDVISAPNNVTLAESRAKFAKAVGSEYGAGREYAADLVAFFMAEGHGTAWITMPHDEKGPAGDAMRAERTELYTALKGIHSNPSVKWKQVKGYAAEFIAAKEKAEAIERGEPVEDTDSQESKGTARHTRTTQLTLIEDLSTLFKHCKKNEKLLTNAQREAHVLIGSALSALGVNISTL